MPEITGARLVVALLETVIANAGREVLVLPSLTLITMFEVVPTFVLAGVPLNAPVEELKLVHDGLFEMEKVRGSPFASLAEGRKL
ncbi:MAG TPA: hypothetical protein VFS24_15610 [Steroidobacteraceae bacterium]|nr:hypothetical protein [Steroidobacteraceae bacterium]